MPKPIADNTCEDGPSVKSDADPDKNRVMPRGQFLAVRELAGALVVPFIQLLGQHTVRFALDERHPTIKKINPANGQMVEVPNVIGMDLGWIGGEVEAMAIQAAASTAARLHGYFNACWEENMIPGSRVVHSVVSRAGNTLDGEDRP